ncbi:MAG: RagB/SusD family nutrient uptake outer membrane protein [Prevotellaceae bacterium]|jgi:hypothetical protein|nr:RagB/SusD family nutrient uptake outer membrane protein [Prevotellaceae bacterium]
MRHLKVIILITVTLLYAGCSDYLDIVPEGVPTLDNAFSNRSNAEKFLFTCYSRLPNPASDWHYPAMVGGDEIWWDFDGYTNYPSFNLAHGYQNANDPLFNFWDGGQDGKNIFVGIRDCNIFIENIHRPHDLDDYQKRLWAAEVKVLKAYMHYFLMTLYGPIPLIKENLPVNASPDQVRMYREPIDDVVNYIVQLIDEAAPDLPEFLVTQIDGGRINRPIALAIKAKALVWAASPLFNGGNPEYAQFKDNKGRQLIPSTRDNSKWERAATAIKEAIDAAHTGKHALYTFPADPNLSDTTNLKYTLRYAVTQRYNSEIVWPDTHSTWDLQHRSMPLLQMENYNGRAHENCATLKIAEQFYTDKGIPVDEDPTWDYANRYVMQKAGADHRYYIQEDETTVKLHFNREPRFHAWVGFDRGIFEGAGRLLENQSFYLQLRQGEAGGMRSSYEHNVTGYQLKKLVNPKSLFAGGNSMTEEPYTFPLIRLSDLYLLYAEALNEANGPSPEVYRWIDTVRNRAGLKGVVESWAQSTRTDKPANQTGLRDIIQRERLIELCFEGQRFWDLRRWMLAHIYLSQPVQGWSYRQDTPETYYVIQQIWTKRRFLMRDYLWPLKTSSVIVNSNLKQNPGW